MKIVYKDILQQMKYYSKIVLLIISVSALVTVITADYVSMKIKQYKQAKIDDENQQLEGFISTLIVIIRANLSGFEKQRISGAIVRTTGLLLSDIESRKGVAVFVAIESKFNKNAKSPVGAVGLTQIMPKYSKEFGKQCNIDIQDTDNLSDPELNLLLGVCQFKQLMKIFNNTALALVAYNAGQNSESLKELKSLQNIKNTETANYVSRFTYLKNAAETEVNKKEKHEKNQNN